MYDAMVAAWDSKYAYNRPSPSSVDPAVKPGLPENGEPSYPSEHAAIAGAAAAVLTELFPDEALYLNQVTARVLEARLASGLNYRTDVEEGLKLGAAVARLVLERARRDGSDAVWDGSGQVRGECRWEPTPPAFKSPLEPNWGKVKTWILTSGSELRPPEPFVCGSQKYLDEHREVKTVVEHLTEDQKRIALEWADGPGTLTPPGHWNLIAWELVQDAKWNTPRAARAFALLNAAQADAFVSCWDTKFTHWGIRPVTAVNRLFDANWKPFLETPPFPGFSSGHSTTSGAASEVLAYLFPTKAAGLRAQAEEASISRLYGGIHVRADLDAGLAIGRRISLKAVQWAESDGSKTGH